MIILFLLSKMSKYFFFLLLILSTFCQENNETQINETQTNETMEEEEPEIIEEDPFLKMDLPNIIHLSDSNYTSELKKYEQAFLLIYASWCNHCHELMPEYNETANYFKENKENITFFKIDGSQNMNVSIDFEIPAFPRIFFINKGKRYQYRGPRNKKGLVYFRKRKLVDDVFKIEKLDELKNIKNALDTKLIVLSTIKVKNSKIYDSFLQFGKSCLFMDLVSCVSEECLNKYGEDITLLKPFDEKENSYKKEYGNLEDAKNDSVKDFASSYGIETGVFATQHDVNLWFEFQKKIVMYIRDSNNEEHVKYDALFKDLGYKLRKNNTYTFTMSPDGNSIQTLIINDLLILPEEFPCIVYYDIKSGDPIAETHIFRINGADMKNVNEKYLFDFLHNIKNGKIRRSLFSEPPLNETKYIRGMKYVTGRDFDKEITDEKQNVLLCVYLNSELDFEFDFLDILGNMTEKYKNDPEKNLKFTILNYRMNEPRDLELNENIFPRIFLYTNAMEEKKTIKFVHKNDTEISYEEVEEFLTENLKWEKKEASNASNETKKEENQQKEEDL